ncbi:MAG: hypothetical protein E7203_08910 [Selenomonas ruminantium]|jgi:flagellin|uniref:Flagellin n=2 Tax=Selenomonas ruminantium TaxID=971 RepID=A0A927WLU0_SELRU|nr:hypothetical protein [Selenomonas ruminantium]
MKVMNNSSAMMALGELKKNQLSLDKQLKKVGSGMKINSAGDGASEYSISEKMRVRIRALGQNDGNVKKGADMLSLAEAGIQNQISILRTVKEKAILAQNDTNTDIDRQIIQKEINQGYQQMADIAADTMYNDRRVLLEGNAVEEVVKSWVVKDKAEKVEGSELDGLLTYRQHETSLIDELDGQEGPFDTFIEWKEKSKISSPAPEISALNLSATQSLVDGDPATANTFTIDLSASYSSVTDLLNVGIEVPKDYGYTYVLTNNTSNKYRNIYNTINISGCTTLAQVASTIASKINKDYVSAVADGTKIEFTTKGKGAYTNSLTANGFSRNYEKVVEGAHGEIQAAPGSPAVAATGVIGTGRLSGGKNDEGEPGVPDMPFSPGTNATGSWNIANVASGSGIVLKDSRYSTSSYIYIRFQDGSSWPSGKDSDNIYNIGKNATGSFTIGGVRVSFSNGVMSATTTDASRGATLASYFSISDGIAEGAAKAAVSYQPASAGTEVEYQAVKALSSLNNTVVNHKTGKDATNAHYDIDLTSYQTSDEAVLEEFIASLLGKGITLNSASSSQYGYGVEFIDSDAVKDGVPTTDTLSKLNDPSHSSVNRRVYPATHLFNTIDLAQLRRLVDTPMTIANAFAKLMSGQSGVSFQPDGVNLNTDDVTAIRYSAPEGYTLDVYEGELRHYDLDFGQWFANHPNASIPGELDGKGFRAYCATDNSQWFNFLFLNGTGDMDDKPLSGTDTQDIKTIIIDVSEVTDASSLVKAIYEQATPVLTGDDARFNHLMRLAGDTENGVLTLYDERRFPVTFYPDYQTKGAKISGGVMDNVLRELRNVYVDRLIIQDTDHASQNIRISIPRTTMDHVFGYIPGSYQPEDFNVLTQESREKLLGIEPEVGILDKGLTYLIDANTLIGAQINRMRNAGANITTAAENTQASESTLRDADMAKEMTGYTKANILSQTAQSMLAQANQNSSQVLSLLS